MKRQKGILVKKALFLDRDGVINKEKNYLYKVEEFEFIDGVFDTCKFFQDRGYELIIITNQAGIARGYYTEEDFHKLNDWMLEEFKKRGIKISKVYFCPHHPDFTGECECRKPKPGMILQAQGEFGLDLSSSILVGDKESDIRVGKNAGVGLNVLVKSGHKIDEKNTQADLVLKSIKDLKRVL